MRRRQYRADVPTDLIEDGIADYPDDFNWKYFQAAPRDQRIADLRGDEWIMLEGLHRTHERIRARLPRAQGLCRVYSYRDVGAPEMVTLRATMLHIEPDDDRCSLLYRGHFPIASELCAAELVLAGAVQCGDEPLHWPSRDHIDMLASPAPESDAIKGRIDEDLMQTAVSAGADEPRRVLGAGYRLGENKIQLAVAPPAYAEPPPEAYFAPPHEPPPVMPPSNIPPPPSFRGSNPGSYQAWQQHHDQWARESDPRFPVSSAIDEAQLYASNPGVPSGAAVENNPYESTDEMDDPDADAAEDAGIRVFETTQPMGDDDA
jgi:hypothetical protein